MSSPPSEASILRRLGEREQRAIGSVDGALVYAVGDIHGRYDLMKALLAQIVSDARVRAMSRRPVLLFCGDYVDRGPQSNRVLEALIWLKARAEFDVRALKGNHEFALLEFLERPECGKSWLRNGAGATFSAYGVEPPDPEGEPSVWPLARDQLLAAMPSSHLRLLERLDLMVVIGDFVFVHAGLRPGAPLEKQTEKDLLWIREDFIASSGPFDKVVVHGHTWVDDEPQIHAHRIGLDTGAYETGVLTAMRFDGSERQTFRAVL